MNNNSNNTNNSKNVVFTHNCERIISLNVGNIIYNFFREEEVPVEDQVLKALTRDNIPWKKITPEVLKANHMSFIGEHQVPDITVEYSDGEKIYLEVRTDLAVKNGKVGGSVKIALGNDNQAIIARIAINSGSEEVKFDPMADIYPMTSMVCQGKRPLSGKEIQELNHILKFSEENGWVARIELLVREVLNWVAQLSFEVNEKGALVYHLN